MANDGAILIGKSGKPENLLLKLANRHGLVTGATGTGKSLDRAIALVHVTKFKKAHRPAIRFDWT